ncbi:hypothetical protein D8B26_004367 [Coccidioides posadasii str. Silveira]|uniref:uncharacterized protein n=1 Tax=Coccidioides posadasii (strain RMSCC 757 / Silveira) TaxID=443226 RepID=UPI001BEEF95A|nr:hypothetical protein D8B26_004367 [Coccidioides posadasii str. Silveira]
MSLAFDVAVASFGLNTSTMSVMPNSGVLSQSERESSRDCVDENATLLHIPIICFDSHIVSLSGICFYFLCHVCTCICFIWHCKRESFSSPGLGIIFVPGHQYPCSVPRLHRFIKYLLIFSIPYFLCLRYVPGSVLCAFFIFYFFPNHIPCKSVGKICLFSRNVMLFFFCLSCIPPIYPFVDPCFHYPIKLSEGIYGEDKAVEKGRPLSRGRMKGPRVKAQILTEFGCSVEGQGGGGGERPFKKSCCFFCFRFPRGHAGTAAELSFLWCQRKAYYAASNFIEILDSALKAEKGSIFG